MKTITEDLGLIKYFPSIKILCRYLESLEEDLSLAKAENVELREELKRERQQGLEDITKLINKFTEKQEIQPSQPNFWERQEGESVEDYELRLKNLQPQSSSFRNHNTILNEAYQDHLKVLKKKNEDAARNKEKRFVIGDSKRAALVEKARAIVENSNE
jgi:thiamine phosphate synthase YjbQ (UPF0047 family)